MPNIIFLDVDGPLIPASLYGTNMHCSAERSLMSTTAIGWLNILCKETDAKVVMNSAHNYWGDLKADVIKNGLRPENFHEHWRTGFPNAVTKPGNRLSAIEDWIEDQFPESPFDCNWVCFDDANFTNNKRLVLIDYNNGITHTNYLKAHNVLGTRPKLLGF